MHSLPGFADVTQARERLRGHAHETPVLTSRTLDALSGRQVFLKCENFQRVGSFKFRGAYNLISQLGEAERRAGVLAFSSGNHAQGVALSARLLGVSALICMPEDAPAVKVEATRGYGAELRFYDRVHDNWEMRAEQFAAEFGRTLVPAFDHPQIIAGQGTAALELLDAVPDLDALVVPISGGGLIAGCALAAHGRSPALRVFGVEPEDADDTLRSLRAGERLAVPPPRTIADGLRVPIPGALTFPIVQRHVADVLTVSDDAIGAAVRFALLRLKLVIEPSGAAALAPLLLGTLPPEARRVGVLLSGGNLAPQQLASLLAVGAP